MEGTVCMFICKIHVCTCMHSIFLFRFPAPDVAGRGSRAAERLSVSPACGFVGAGSGRRNPRGRGRGVDGEAGIHRGRGEWGGGGGPGAKGRDQKGRRGAEGKKLRVFIPPYLQASRGRD